MLTFFKKILIRIYSFFIYLFNGLREGEKLIMGDKNNALDDGVGEEQQMRHNSVWQDLVNHELTQRVIDLRYETEHVNRRSIEDYDYVGNGTVKKKNKMFQYKGNAENSEKYNIDIVQENNEDIKGVIGATSENSHIKNYRIKLKYDFIPRLRFDSYITKSVIKSDVNNNKFIDIYVSKYHEKYNNKHKFFLSEIKKIIEGDRRSDILDIIEISFTTMNAFGISDGITLTYNNINFLNIVEYDGSYVLKFSVNEKSSKDLIENVYNEESERKFNEKVERETFKNDMGDFIAIENKKENEEEYYKKVEELLNGDKN